MHRPAFILAGMVYVLMLAVGLAVLEHHLEPSSRWWASAMSFVLGAGIGSTGIRSMIAFLDANWPFVEFYERLTGGRFFTLKCPMLTSAYWRALREFRRARAEQGLPSRPGLRTRLLAFLPLVLAVVMATAAMVWLEAPGTSGMQAFLGCMLTWGGLSKLLWWRSLPE